MSGPQFALYVIMTIVTIILATLGHHLAAAFVFIFFIVVPLITPEGPSL